MNARRFFRSTNSLIFTVAMLALVSTSFASAPQEKVLYNFQGAPDGVSSSADLVMDAKGNLYGTTTYGGTGTCNDGSGGSISCGTVFRLTPPSTTGGAWTETILYSFLGPTGDGQFPGSPLLLGNNGNLYGTTGSGGNGTACASGNISAGCGVVFQLSPPAQAGGPWTETILYNFQDTGDGYVPIGGLAVDGKGNLYGATLFDGTAGLGVVYRLSPPAQSGGSWTETVLYNFQGNGDGSGPQAGLTFDKTGNLFGTTYSGGSANLGTVFQLSPSHHGQSWTESVLFSFLGSSSGDAANPTSRLTFDTKGNLYGTTTHGGSSSNCFQAACGTVFSLTHTAGSWTEQVLYSFQGGSDGQYPYAKVTFDKKGNLWGTTFQGGSVNSYGTIFKMTPSGSGWTEQVVHSFQGFPDGDLPIAGLLLGANGKFYGTTTGDAMLYGTGTVFEVSTPSSGPQP
jgi:uncharacterized repeat protein (TIGR03803 family)